MRLLEVKNNLIKLAYSEEESPVLGRFLALMTEHKCYVAQFINLKTDNINHFAVARLLFTFTKDGVVDNYDGSIPDMNADVTFLPTSELLDLLPVETPVKMGRIAQQQDILSLDISVFENNFTVFADQSTNIFTFISNCARQLFQMREKVVILDSDGIFEGYPSMKLGKDFKLPLDSSMINYLIENETEETDFETKAVIQDILYEIRSYVQSLEPEFIPIDALIDVMANQFKETKMPELALLKNKLIKYKQANIFANLECEFGILEDKFSTGECVVVDISDIGGVFQGEVINYIHKKLMQTENFAYMFVTLDDGNSNKKLLKKLLNNNHVFSTIIVNHGYKYVKELKSASQNIVIFQPQSEENEFGMYRAFLDKLNMQECVIIGRLTQKVPFIADCSNLNLGLTIEDTLGEAIEFVPKIRGSIDASHVAAAATVASNIDFVTKNAMAQQTANVQAQGAVALQDPPQVQNQAQPIQAQVQMPGIAQQAQSAEADNDLPEIAQANVYEEQATVQNLEDLTATGLEAAQEENNYVEEQPILDTSVVDNIPENFQPQPTIVEPEQSVAEAESEQGFEQVAPDIQSMIQDELTKDEDNGGDLENLGGGLEDLGVDLGLPGSGMEDASMLGLDGSMLEGIEDMAEGESAEIPYTQDQYEDNSAQTEDLSQMSEEPIAMEEMPSEDLSGLADIQTEESSVAPLDNFATEPAEDIPPMSGMDDVIEDDNSEMGLGDNLGGDLFAGGDMSDMSLGGDLTEADLDFIEETQDIPLGGFGDEPGSLELMEDSLPVYSADVEEEGEEVESNVGFTKGDTVTHPKYGTGVIEKIIKYGNKTLCSILFEEVGRRLLDPSVSEFTKI